MKPVTCQSQHSHRNFECWEDPGDEVDAYKHGKSHANHEHSISKTVLTQQFHEIKQVIVTNNIKLFPDDTVPIVIHSCDHVVIDPQFNYLNFFKRVPSV